MVGKVPPCASYISIMIHESNEGVLARYPRDSHTKSWQEQTWKKKMYVLSVSERGVGYPLVLYKKVLQQGVFPPCFPYINLMYDGPPPPGRVTTG